MLVLHLGLMLIISGIGEIIERSKLILTYRKQKIEFKRNQDLKRSFRRSKRCIELCVAIPYGICFPFFNTTRSYQMELQHYTLLLKKKTLTIVELNEYNIALVSNFLSIQIENHSIYVNFCERELIWLILDLYFDIGPIDTLPFYTNRDPIFDSIYIFFDIM